jgi:hypothetical protein
MKKNIDSIRNAILRGSKEESKLTPLCFSIGGFTSPKIRHTLNLLGELAENFLEIGSHRGATFIASIYKNSNIKQAWAIDNFSEFEDGTVKQELLDNFELFKNNIPPVGFMERDCFNIDLSLLPKIDFFCYDGNHSYEAQKRAFSYFYPVLADEVLICVDDTDWLDPMKGTIDGIRQNDFEVLFEYKASGTDGYHNGFYIALLKKAQVFYPYGKPKSVSNSIDTPSFGSTRKWDDDDSVSQNLLRNNTVNSYTDLSTQMMLNNITMFNLL